MSVEKELHRSSMFGHLDLLSQQVVEGYISGLHKSPFHGFAAEFAEHKMYNAGESTKHIDWKLYAKTDKLYTKKYEEETNLRCHIIVDNSSSMHYPKVEKFSLESLNKIGFSALAAASLMKILQRQRDAVGLSIYSDSYEYYSPEKSSERHIANLLAKLDGMVASAKEGKQTETYTFLHQIAENVHRRSLIFLFTDMFQAGVSQEALFSALQHLKYNKHELVLFHVVDKATEMDFDFENRPKRFLDVETGARLDVFPEQVQEAYKKEVQKYVDSLLLRCGQYGIKYVSVDVREGFEKIMNTYLIERQKFK
ncbi:MAG: DUF58 domain-containing protein [Flavobacteriaceae bacterium]|nr:DUF58 domain-containing protein [Flavobacteriaceae bacterium]